MDLRAAVRGFVHAVNISSGRAIRSLPLSEELKHSRRREKRINAGKQTGVGMQHEIQEIKICLKYHVV